MSKKHKTYLLLLANMILWGSAFVTSKLAINSVQAPVSASIRFGLAAIMFGIFLIFQTKHTRKVSKSNLWKLLIMGASGVAIYNWLFFVGLSSTQASDGTVIIPAMSPVLTACLAYFLLKERMSAFQISGLILAFGGATLFFFSIGVGTFDQARLWGDLMFIGSSAGWAIYTMIGRTVLKEVHPLIATSYAFIFGGSLLVLFALPEYPQVEWSQLDASYWINQFYMALFPTVLANFFYSYGVKNIGPAPTAMFMFFVPVFGLVLAAVWLHESLDAFQFIGSVIMIFGILLMNKKTGITKEIKAIKT